MLALTIALLVLLLWLGAGVDLLLGTRRIVSLPDVPENLPSSPPRVSVVVAARNEERNIAEAVASLLALDYPNYELLVVDDRSEDATPTILAEMAARNARLRVATVTELPPGWLGKNHALHCGAAAAGGELILFTDADVVMEPTVLSRGVNLFLAHHLDHLAVGPTVAMKGTLLAMFGASFTVIFFSLFARPWKAPDPRSPAHIGIGAFNLVRREAYLAAGGHERIRLRPDDDMKLGKILKMKGFRQEAAMAGALMRVEWYASLGELVRGLEKNAFAGADYRPGLVLLGGVVHLLCSVWPYVALFVTGGAARWCYAATVAWITALFVYGARRQGEPAWYAAGYPLTALLFVWILLRTMTLNLVQGGIAWRGTFYPLDELRRNRV